MEQVSCDRCPLNRFCEALREAKTDERRVSYDRHPMWYECPLISIVIDHDINRKFSLEKDTSNG